MRLKLLEQFTRCIFKHGGLQVVEHRQNGQVGHHQGEQLCFVCFRPDFWWPKGQYFLLHPCEFLCIGHGSLHMHTNFRTSVSAPCFPKMTT